MKVATTTEDFSNYFNNYTDCIKQVAEAGFRYIDLSMYIVHEDDALLIRDDWREVTKEIKACAEDLGVQFVQSHAPGGRMLFDDNTFNEELFKRTVRSIEVCSELGITNTVVHACWTMGMTKDEFFEKNRKFYNSLIPTMEKYGVNVLVENGSMENLDLGYMLTSGEDMRSFIEYVDHPLFHACWDTGHANTLGGQYHHLTALGKHLYAVHINDNGGKNDEHTMPYLGTMNLDDVMHGLIDSGYKGYFTFEACRLLRPSKVWYGNRRPFPSDTRLANPTLAMHSAMEKLLYEIGVHILKAYDCFEE